MATALEKNIDPQYISILENVSDPEIPVLSIMDMGVVRYAQLVDSIVHIKITPTYSGCPAMDVIGDDIISAFAQNDIEAKVSLVLSPAWTTDWITPKGRKSLEEYGIAAPLDEVADKEVLLHDKRIVKCPQCSATNTKMISQFGSTACKALFKCEDCLLYTSPSPRDS